MASRSPYSQSEVQAATPVEQAVARVTLRNSFAHPYDSAIAAARTCYAPRLISAKGTTEKRRPPSGPGWIKAGHLPFFHNRILGLGLGTLCGHSFGRFWPRIPFFTRSYK